MSLNPPSEPFTGSSGAVGGCHVLLEKEISVPIKLGLVLHKRLAGGAVAASKTEWSDRSTLAGGPNRTLSVESSLWTGSSSDSASSLGDLPLQTTDRQLASLPESSSLACVARTSRILTV